MSDSDETKLKKNLKLFDVYAISTGAMFSSGFFLLPGIAAAATGSSVSIAYLVAGFLILPAMFCMAELSTAMPKAGGTYYFLDRSLGPLMGTIGGLGSWVAVVFKSAFALVGMGAYLALFIDVPMTALAIGLTIVFGLINIFGAKETTALQRFLVSTLVVILAAFVIIGLVFNDMGMVLEKNFGDNKVFLSSGIVGFFSTVGLVFVSYAGLTKVASVAEEVEKPDRNIPLGMTLSLITATLIYTLGVIVMVGVLPENELYGSLTPVADAGQMFLQWVPYEMGLILIVVAAVAAFASTGNAGLMSASRYPFAMAKDKLVPERFSGLGRFGTPTFSIIFTVFSMIAILVIFDVESVAKLASAFQLMLFGLISLAVIVMRESKIPTYKPGFRCPLYPWMPIFGIFVSFGLIYEMGGLAVAFTGVMTIAFAIWYFFYGFSKVERGGAINHVHARIGVNRYKGLENELMGIVQERTDDENLSYEDMIARCVLYDYEDGEHDFKSLRRDFAKIVAERSIYTVKDVEDDFSRKDVTTRQINSNVSFWYTTMAEIEKPELVIFRFYNEAKISDVPTNNLTTAMFLVTPKKPAGLDLRLAGHLVEIVQSNQFTERWMKANNKQERRGILMRDGHLKYLKIKDTKEPENWIGKALKDIKIENGCLVTLIERGSEVIIATRDTVLKKSDTVVIIGEPEHLKHIQ